MKTARPKIRGLGGLAAFLGFAIFSPNPHAAEVDESKLPPAATAQVDFARDIKPIFDAFCIRCHGAVEPKSGFRLDTREAALKGGDEGASIIPGSGAKSPIVHYVAGLVPDMEMPPAGKGDPLTKDQIGLLRAWIDQGAVWNAPAATNNFDVTITTTVGGTFVSGDQNKFREHYWRPDGVNGGLTQFEFFEQVDSETSLTSTGHFSVDDYRLTLNVDRNNRGFVHSGWEQFRQYHDDAGGFDPLTGAPPLSLGSDLSLEVGKAWIDFGLTLPHLPKMVLGYEYDYKRGNEMTTVWGSDFAADPRNISPNSRRLDEGTHIVKFDIEGEFKEFAYEDRFRGEFYKLQSGYDNVAARAAMQQSVRDDLHYFQGANSLRVERKVTDWLLTSGGYLYSRLNSEDSFSDLTTANSGAFLAEAPQIKVSRETHMFNVNAMFGPFNGLTFTADAQTEWTRQNGFGGGLLNGIAYARPPGSNLNINFAQLNSDYDQNAVWEGIGLRYCKIPFTTLFADARLRQESIGHNDSDIPQTGGGDSFLQDISESNELADFRAGFNTSPWSRVSFSGHYRRYENDTHYKNNVIPSPLGGYPGFLSSRDTLTDEFEAKVVSRPFNWLKASLGYQYLTTHYRLNTEPAFDPFDTYSPGGALQSGKDDTHIYSLGLLFTPLRRFSFNTTFSYQDTAAATFSEGFVPEYKGNVYSILFNSNFVIDPRTDLSLGYNVSIADYLSDTLPDPTNPPPLGIRYQQHSVQAGLTRRFSKQFTGRLQYGFYRYDEPSILGLNDYTAHAIFTTLTYHFR